MERNKATTNNWKLIYQNSFIYIVDKDKIQLIMFYEFSPIAELHCVPVMVDNVSGTRHAI